MPLIFRSNSEGALNNDSRVKSCENKTCTYDTFHLNTTYIKLPMNPDFRSIIFRDSPADFNYIRKSEYLELSIQTNRTGNKFLLINTAPMIKGRSEIRKTYYTMFNSSEFSNFASQSKKLITSILVEAKRVRAEQIRNDVNVDCTFVPLNLNPNHYINFHIDNEWAAENDFTLTNEMANDLVENRNALARRESTNEHTVPVPEEATIIAQPENADLARTTLSADHVTAGNIDWGHGTHTPPRLSTQPITEQDIANAINALDRAMNAASSDSMVQQLLRRTQAAYEEPEELSSIFGTESQERPVRQQIRARRTESNDMFNYLESGQI